MVVRSLLATACLAAPIAFAGVARSEPPARAGHASDAAARTSSDPAAKPRPGEAAPPAAPTRRRASPTRPAPLHAEFAQYGVAINALVNASPGASCGTSVRAPGGGADAPCIIGSGGGLVIRGGYRSPGPWYIGGAYAFAKLDSSNLYRLGIFQQLWAEMRYIFETGYRASPYVSWGLGGVAYGSQWGVETGGAMAFGGGGIAFEVQRLAVVGLGIVYKPTLIAGWTDTAGIVRPTGVAHFVGIEVQVEVRTEIGRR